MFISAGDLIVNQPGNEADFSSLVCNVKKKDLRGNVTDM